MTGADGTADDGGSDGPTDGRRTAGSRGGRSADGRADGRLRQERVDRSWVRRRRFLASFGATAAAAGLAGCEELPTETPGTPGANETEALPEVSTRAPDYEEVSPSMQVDGFEIALFSDFMTLAE